MEQIVECVPNFSEGRRPAVIEAIAGAIRDIPGAAVLDVSPDPDHNRTVITFVGSPAAVEEAAFQAIRQAASLIDLEQHEGEHPRLGATDVCPFIPVRGVTLDDCVALARRLGQRVGEELGIAVYFYAAAATRPERESLSRIRKGEYELWKEEIGANPARQPDCGPAEARPWGATVIGARPFLIAYNLYLNTGDVKIANQIARAVRFSSGGLRHVQALGFLVEGQAQVSMNLTDFTKTPIHRVQELVRREAAQRGLAVTRAELVGLAPQEALLAAARWYLQLGDLPAEQILERRLEQVLAEAGPEKEHGESAEPPVDPFAAPVPFIDAVAAPSATPGGGAVAGLAGALGAALARMMAGLTLGRRKYADAADLAAEVDRAAADLGARLVDAMRADAAAFEAVLAAYRDRSLDKAARAAAVQRATVGAGEVPLRVARLARDVAALAQRIVAVGNVNAASDGASAGILARAAVAVAVLNVRTNAAALADRDLAERWLAETDALLAETEQIVAATVATASERGGFA